MDELSEDQLRELEEQLYSQVHHQISTQEANISEESANVVVSKKGNANRYWVKKDDKGVQNQKPNESSKEHVQTIEKGNKVNPKDNRVRNPFAGSPQQKNQSYKKNNQSNGPFHRQAQKLQRAKQYENKKQKANNARSSMLKRPKIIETVTLESSDNEMDNDEVIVVPLPPPPVYNIDDSDEDEKSKKSDEGKETNAYEGSSEGAFATPKSKKSAPSVTANDQSSDAPSRCNSPNSVMSQDDFIGQNDRQRLLKNTIIAEDSDLLVINNNSDSLLDPPTPTPVVSGKAQQQISEDIECIGTFIKPTGTTPRGSSNKQCYRVDQSGLRAMDVYESESDIVSDGVYSKGKEKLHPPNTTIRNIDKSSESELDDVATPQHTKTKRFRKRRASGSHGCLSGGVSSSESDEDNGVEPTGVSFISRGPAVESCKRKRMRKSSTSTSQNHMSDSVFLATLNSLAQGSNSKDVASQQNNDDDDDSDTERFPTARDIAETVLNQEEQNTSTNVEPEREEEETTPTTESIDLAETAVPHEIADDIEKLFDKINELSSKKAMEISDESDCEISGVTPVDDVVNNSATTAEDLMEQSVEPASTAADEQENKTADSGIKYFIGYTPANRFCTSDGFGWDEEMRRFYNCSWGGENFREDLVMGRMNRDRRLWAISDEDRYLMRTRRDRREKCINCYSFGHSRARCPKPRKAIVCYMCGESGHYEARCPKTRCLRCGSRTTTYTQSCNKCIFWNNRTCPICKLRGHTLNDCPDKWRRYHSTTRPNTLLESKVIYNKRRFCCFCGRRGHLSDECRTALYRSDYPPISTEIKSHEKSYQDTMINPFYKPEIPCRLLYDPKVEVNCGLAAQTTHKKTYGRFLCAVGLGHLIGANNNRVTTRNSPPETAVSSTVPIAPEANSTTTSCPEQVSEVSESTNKNSTQISESLQMPPPQTQDHPTTPTPNEPIVNDSDSNYSFSDHFELPTTSQQSTAKKTAPLPDFISLNSKPESQQKYKKFHQEDQPQERAKLDKSNANAFGISARFIEFFSDDEEHPTATVAATAQPEEPDNVPAGVPCEAKIYISKEHSNYFQSNLGQQYLSKIMIDNNLNGRLDKTIVGYALFINGLPADQEKLQSELEMKFRMLDDEKLERSTKVPKNVHTLISRLRSKIKELYNYLGNATELCRNLNEMDKQKDKASIKQTDRIRTTLNMIFLGQAGLSDGDKHVETLIDGLQSLLKDCKGKGRTPDELRNKIDLSYRMLFTPFRQKDYSELLLAYQKLSPALRNRLPQLNLQPSLLGNPQFNIAANDDQRTRFCGGANKQNVSHTTTTSRAVEDGTLLLNVVSNKNNQIFHDKPPASFRENLNAATEKPNISEKFKKHGGELLDKDCQELLSDILPFSNHIVKAISNPNMRLPSAFWSRESLRLLMQLINSERNNPTTLKRLTNISRKAASGELSYSDYRIVSELYNITVQINKK